MLNKVICLYLVFFTLEWTIYFILWILPIGFWTVSWMLSFIALILFEKSFINKFDIFEQQVFPHRMAILPPLKSQEEDCSERDKEQ